MSDIKHTKERIQLYIENESWDKIASFLNELHPADIAEIINQSPEGVQNNLFEFDTKLKKINPLETGLIDYISFNKGCYVGQEVIARLHNYKKISREIIKFQSSENMIINAPFKSQDNISGKILSITKDKTEFVGLCLIKKKDVGKISSDFLLI